MLRRRDAFDRGPDPGSFQVYLRRWCGHYQDAIKRAVDNAWPEVAGDRSCRPRSMRRCVDGLRWRLNSTRSVSASGHGWKRILTITPQWCASGTLGLRQPHAMGGRHARSCRRESSGSKRRSRRRGSGCLLFGCPMTSLATAAWSWDMHRWTSRRSPLSCSEPTKAGDRNRGSRSHGGSRQGHWTQSSVGDGPKLERSLIPSPSQGWLRADAADHNGRLRRHRLVHAHALST